MGSWQDKDGDGKVAWYPDYEGEKPAAGQNPSDVETVVADPAPKAGEQTGNQAPIYFGGTGNPSASLSSKGEALAEFNEAFAQTFGATVPKELAAAFTNELRALQASRTTKPSTKGGIDYVTQGVSPQERKNILDKYLKQYATDVIGRAATGDNKALADLQKGQFGVAYTTLKNAYAENGITYNLKSLATLASESALNPDRLKSNVNLVNLQAKTLFPALAKQIDNGYTVKQLLSPYIQARANILEEDPDAIDVKSMANVAKDPNNLMGLYDYEISLRQDPKWRFTKNAQDSLSNVARSLAQTFGLVG